MTKWGVKLVLLNLYVVCHSLHWMVPNLFSEGSLIVEHIWLLKLQRTHKISLPERWQNPDCPSRWSAGYHEEPESYSCNMSDYWNFEILISNGFALKKRDRSLNPIYNYQLATMWNHSIFIFLCSFVLRGICIIVSFVQKLSFLHFFPLSWHFHSYFLAVCLIWNLCFKQQTYIYSI